MIGRTIGSYVILDKLGSGGMGEVYLAEHTRIERRAAIKFLLPGLSQDAEVVTRFFNEARATSAIRHPGIVEIFDCDVLDERAYIVMEFLEGESLAAITERVGSFAAEPAAVVAVLGRIASALSAAHAKGIVHRDLKPENAFLTLQRGEAFGVKILDFGIAKLAGDIFAGASQTRPGSVLGTPLYMSPEQCRAVNTVDHRADIYALGCIAFELLAGRTVFEGDGPGDLLVAHIAKQAPRVSSLVPGVPPQLDNLIASMLAKSPDDRPQSMDSVISALEGLVGVPCADFVRKVPVTSRMIPVPPVRRMLGPTRAMAAITPSTVFLDSGGAPAAAPVPAPMPSSGSAPIAGGTMMLPDGDLAGYLSKRSKSGDSSGNDSTFRRTASELIPDVEPPRSRRSLFVVGGAIAAAAVVAVVLLSGPSEKRRTPPPAVPAPPIGEVTPPAPPPPPERPEPVRPADPVPAVPAKPTLVQERKADDKPADPAKKPAHHDAKVAQKTEKAIVEKKIEHKPEKSKTERKDKSKPAKPVYFPVGD